MKYLAFSKTFIFYYIRLFKKENFVMLCIIALGSLTLTAWGISSSYALTSLANYEVKKFYMWILIMIVSLIIWSLQIHLDSWYYTKVVQKMNTQIRIDIAEHLGNIEYQDFHQKSSGEYTSWMTNDINMINDYGYATLQMIITQIFTITFSSIALFSFHFSLNIAVFFFAIIMIITPKFFSKSMNRKINEVSNANEKFTNYSNDIFDKYDLYYSTNNEKILVEKFEKESLKLANKKISLATLTGYMYGTNNFVSLISQVAILLVAALLFFKNIAPIGTITAAQYFSATIFTSLMGISSNYVELKTTQPIFEKFFKSKRRVNNKEELLTISQGIEFSNVSFKYDDEVVLDNVNLKFEPGKKYALVGPSGSGKSTILKLLMGFINDYDGAITVDGKDVKTFSKDSWVNKFTYLEQKSPIIVGTLLENIDISNANNQIDIANLMDKVGLSEWTIDKDVSNYIINENVLSGGQKQKIAYARSLIRDTEIILFDEGTSALDRESASIIEEDILNSNKTVIIISHHLTDDIKSRLDTIYYL